MEQEKKSYSIDEVDEIVKNLRSVEITRKKEYWKKCGEVLFSDEAYMVEKWHLFVEEFLIKHFDNYVVLDQIIQIISIIKMGMPIEKIKMICDTIAYREIVLDALPLFVHPEFFKQLTETKSRNNI